MPLLNLPEARLRERTSLKWRAYPPDVLPLWVAEMDADVPGAVRDALEDALRRGDTGYPFGTAYAEAYADMAEARWAWRPAPEQLRRSGDVMNAILALLVGNTNEGDHILINPPVYPPFWQVISGYRRHVTQAPLTAAGRLDLTAVEDALTGPDHPTAYLLCSPHNPTGTLHSAEELSAVARLCRAHGVLLVVDEIHAPLVDPGETFVPILSLPDAQDAVVAFSAGKGWNLAAFKGGLFVRGTGAQAAFDNLPPLANQSTGQFATIAHTAALVGAQEWLDELRVEIAANKRLLATLLADRLPEVGYTPAPATYLAWLDCAGFDLPDPSRHFLDVGRVALNRGADFGPAYRQFARLNLAASPDMIGEAVARMARSLGR